MATATGDAADGGDDDDATAHVCMVCLEALRAGELVRCLPCMHFYHVSCIDPWLKRKNSWYAMQHHLTLCA